MFPAKLLSVLIGLSVVAVALVAATNLHSDSGPAATEAPTGFKTPTYSDNPGSQSTSNGLVPPPGDTFALDQATFEEEEGVDSGLGPVFNARSCTDCHQNPVTGGSSQVTEFRAGHDGRHDQFVNPTVTIADGRATIADRSLINDRAICPKAQELVPDTEDVRTLRLAVNLLGDGFVEAIDDSTLLTIARQQPKLSNGKIAGEAIQVPILEAPGQTRIGRFGWKDQHASLLSFSSDAYLNESGITNRLNPVDITSVCKTTTDPEDTPDDIGLADIDHFAFFIRGTLAPPVDHKLFNTDKAQAGQQIFSDIGCAMCHIPSITTAPTGTVINGGTFTVPDALGNKIIHPFSDFLLHDIGTGDGIVQNGPADTANKLRTAPLWGLRTRTHLMHDGLSVTVENAIERHSNEAAQAARAFKKLSDRQEDQLLTFLNSL
jgi:CxxC motif-containing protein (DUF1111 family)